MPLSHTAGVPSFGAILLRGLLAGLIAGLLAGGFGFAAGEPQIDAAIAIEEAAAHTAAAAAAGPTDDHHADELVGRGGQKAGLFLAMGLFGVAMGGLLAVAYTLLRRRLHTRNDAQAAVMLAGAGLLGAVVVPFVKYPANPPAVGNAGTADARTVSYLALVVIGLVAVWAAVVASRAVRDGAPEWLRWLAGVTAFLAVVTVAYVALPTVDEVPATFPAGLLWNFRLVSLGTLIVLWSALGLAFAALLTGTAAKSSSAVSESAAPVSR